VTHPGTDPLVAELRQAIVDCQAARAKVLDLWPEGVHPDDLPADEQEMLQNAMDAVIEADKRWESLQARLGS
jgi:hypothetical protein